MTRRTVLGGVGNVVARAGRAVRPAGRPDPAATPRNAASTMGSSLFSGGQVGTGGSELEQNAQVSTLFSVVDLKASAVAAVDWYLERVPPPGADPDAEPVRVTTHAALDLLNRPNPIMGRQEFFELSEQYFSLVGEWWWLVVRDRGLPLEMWPIRPDRIAPVPGLAENAPAGRPWGAPIGYVYTGEKGQQIRLGLDEVIFGRRPDGRDPYGRGIGPVQSLMADLDGIRYSAAWNRQFFLNDATPGGVVELDRELSDEQWAQFRDRWNEQHRGIRNAWRVAILEKATFTPMGFSAKDMQFVELRSIGPKLIQEAFRIHDHMLGKSADVNLANAQAAEYTFSKWNLVPDLARFKSAINNELVPMYNLRPGPPAVRFEFCNPVVEDRDSQRADEAAAVTNFAALLNAGADPAWAAEVAGLPEPVMKAEAFSA